MTLTTGSTEHTAINEILASVGQAPVTTLDQTNPDVAIAHTTLLQVSREVQAEGWTFNQEFHVEYTPDTNNEIIVPNDILHIDASEVPANVDIDVVIRSGKLYDRHNHTFEFTNGPIECDVIRLYDYADLPKPIQAFITARASAIVSSRIVGDSTQYQILQQNEAYTRALAMQYDTTQADLSFFGKPEGSAKSSYQSFQPFKALYR